MILASLPVIAQISGSLMIGNMSTGAYFRLIVAPEPADYRPGWRRIQARRRGCLIRPHVFFGNNTTSIGLSVLASLAGEQISPACSLGPLTTTAWRRTPPRASSKTNARGRESHGQGQQSMRRRSNQPASSARRNGAAARARISLG